MKEYETVPDDLLSNTTVLMVYLEISYAYTSALKPKETKKEAKK
jgi:hypothetical protein